MNSMNASCHQNINCLGKLELLMAAVEEMLAIEEMMLASGMCKAVRGE